MIMYENNTLILYVKFSQVTRKMLTVRTSPDYVMRCKNNLTLNISVLLQNADWSKLHKACRHDLFKWKSHLTGFVYNYTHKQTVV